MAPESREKLNFLFQCWIRELAIKLQKLHLQKLQKLQKLHRQGSKVKKSCSSETYVCL